jgi:hypothetical protein
MLDPCPLDMITLAVINFFVKGVFASPPKKPRPMAKGSIPYHFYISKQNWFSIFSVKLIQI